MVVILLTETTGGSTQALAIHLDIRTHLTQCRGETETVFVHRFVDNRQTLCLSEGDNQRLLPVGHEAGVNRGFQSDGMELATRVVEADTF